MGQKDLREKLLEDYEDVFSDIFNVLVFKDNVIKKQYLRASATESVYKSETKEYRGQYRDVLKEYTDNCLLEIGSLGIENQSTLDDYMPVRIMGYDYAKYRSQVVRNEYPLLPVITIVLNFSNKPWKENKCLHNIMKIPNEFKSYIQDYKVLVFDIAFLEDEVIERFTCDFKFVAKFFKNKRLGKKDLFENDEINHIEEVIDFLAVFTDDKRYKKIKSKIIKMKKKGRSVRMCEVAQALEEKGIAKGIEKGIKKERIRAIKRMLLKGYSKESILGLDYTEEEYAKAESKFMKSVQKCS